MEWIKQEAQGIWLPEVSGDSIEGEVVGMLAGLYGNQYIIKTSKGELRTPSHKILQARMVDIKINDIVKIIYKGQEPPSVKGNKPTKVYDVFKANTKIKEETVA